MPTNDWGQRGPTPGLDFGPAIESGFDGYPSEDLFPAEDLYPSEGE